MDYIEQKAAREHRTYLRTIKRIGREAMRAQWRAKRHKRVALLASGCVPTPRYVARSLSVSTNTIVLSINAVA